jgi:hypothetical protein
VLVSVDGQLVIAKLFAQRFVYVIPYAVDPAATEAGLPYRVQVEPPTRGTTWTG